MSQNKTTPPDPEQKSEAQIAENLFMSTIEAAPDNFKPRYVIDEIRNDFVQTAFPGLDTPARPVVLDDLLPPFLSPQDLPEPVHIPESISLADLAAQKQAEDAEKTPPPVLSETDMAAVTPDPSPDIDVAIHTDPAVDEISITPVQTMENDLSMAEDPPEKVNIPLPEPKKVKKVKAPTRPAKTAKKRKKKKKDTLPEDMTIVSGEELEKKVKDREKSIQDLLNDKKGSLGDQSV